MEGKTMKAMVIEEYGKKAHHKQCSVPTLAQGELLIKVQASTINPSDRYFMAGTYFQRPLPAVSGIQGTGKVVEAKGEALQSWVGKRVSFAGNKGSWAEYAVSSPNSTFQIDQDVPLSSAASGIVNPLTVVGFVERYKQLGCKGGIIHTAAASSLGRMLNKLCQRQKIPLLNVVRREEHAELLKKQGATHVIITTGQWQKQYKQFIAQHKFDCIFDALGGGPVTEILISNMIPKSTYHLYGGLEQKPLNLSNPFILFQGVVITGFLLFPWWPTVPEERKQKIRSQYSQLLKKQLSTHVYKELPLSQLEEALQLSVSKATQGKITLLIQ